MHGPDSTAHLTYCLSIHPSEDLDDVRAAVFGPALDVARRIAEGTPFGLGLRISAQTARELSGRSDELRDELGSQGLYTFTVNGFPFGRFSGGRVKEQVYEPNWTATDRLEYTIALGEILAALLPEGVVGSVSTSPLVYGTEIPAAATRNLLAAGAAYARIEDETGRRVVLCVEPEPDCAVETSEQAERLFERLGDEGEAHALDHLGVCLDTCHMLTNFESPAQSLTRLEEAGIEVRKIQLSAALRVREGEDPAVALAPFADPVYLHQTRVRTPSGEVLRYPDLPSAIEADADGEWRVHYHVPLHRGAEGVVETLSPLDDPEFVSDAFTPGRHLEVETYTFALMPGRSEDVVDSIVAELSTVLLALSRGKS